MLGKFSKTEIDSIKEILEKTLVISKALLNTDNVEKVMNIHNQK